ncbi:MAG: hypothetical protein M3Y45_07125, partial [Actinomycetota bacterium]|nr:hypothetical protein [Actinomycetota bacterium]
MSADASVRSKTPYVSRLASFVLALAAVLLLFAGAASADAATLNVETAGSDAGDCTSSACATLQYALNQADSGDTIQVGAGTFTSGAPVSVTNGVTISGVGAG